MKNSSKVIISVLLVVSLGLAGFSGMMYMESQDQQQEINELQTDYDDLSDRYSNLENEKDQLQSEYDALTQDYETLSQDYETLAQDFEELEEKTTPIISSYHFLTVSDGVGEVQNFEAAMLDGDGDLYLDIVHTSFGEDLQNSAQMAKYIANHYTEKNLRTEKDTILRLDLRDTSSSISGPSAGAAQTIAILSVAQEKHIDNDILITGTIESDGSIGKVGGVKAKVQAAKEFGAEKILVPEGQSVNISGITVEEVGHIEEAMTQYGLEPKDVNYPLYLNDFYFVTKIGGDYETHKRIYNPNETVSVYFDIEDFEIDGDGYSRYEQYVTVHWPDGSTDSYYDNLEMVSGSTEGATIIWFTNDLDPPTEGWDEGEYRIEIRVVDSVGEKDLTFSRTFEVV